MNLNTEILSKVDKEYLIEDQLSLKPVFKKINIKDIRYVAGVDITYPKDSNVGICCIVVYDMVNKREVEVVIHEEKITFPYVPGFLCYREYPIFKATLKKLMIAPDVFIFDGNGTLHERQAGLAVFAGCRAKINSIGISKNLYKIDDILYEDIKENKKGSYYKILKDNKVIGHTLLTKDNSNPVYVSSGNGVNQNLAVKIALSCTNDIHRIPEPTRLADRYSRDYLSKTYSWDYFKHKEMVLNELFLRICENKSESFVMFLNYLKDKKYFKNLSFKEINNCFTNGIPYKLTNGIDNITFGFSESNDKLLVGIDPTSCYNKCSSSSILINFPMNKRSYKQMINHLDKIFDKKTEISKRWFKEASSSWCGSWQEF